ncbi:MAG: molybdenum cofactor synthesis domain-containing protein [Actinomycetota bacterium]
MERQAAVLTVSDGVSSGTRDDVSGRALVELLGRCGFSTVAHRVVADEREEIEAALRALATQARLVVTTGGTGLGPRDVTPEATKAVIEREAPGLPETMRALGRARAPMAILSRAAAGVLQETLIINLPGGPKGAVESLESVISVLPHALDLIAGHTRHGPDFSAKHAHDHHDHPHAGSRETASPESAAGAAGTSDMVAELSGRLQQGEEVILATAIRTHGAPPCQPGQKLLLGPGGPLSGTLGCSEFDVAAAGDAGSILADGVPTLRTYDHDLGSVEVYLEPYRKRPRLVVLGGTPIALWLMRWGRDLGYEPVLVETRPEWITPEHRGATNLILDSPDSLPVDAETDVVHTDHDAPLVAEHIAALLAKGPRFVGIMGSARHASHHLDRLREMGIPEKEVARIQTPVGLNIGARSPQEIALSVLAGVIAHRSGRGGGWIDARKATKGARMESG